MGTCESKQEWAKLLGVTWISGGQQSTCLDRLAFFMVRGTKNKAQSCVPNPSSNDRGEEGFEEPAIHELVQLPPNEPQPGLLFKHRPLNKSGLAEIFPTRRDPERLLKENI